MEHATKTNGCQQKCFKIKSQRKRVPGKLRDYKELFLNPEKSTLRTPDNIDADDIHSPFFGTAKMTTGEAK
jgi:hypothetical protein